MDAATGATIVASVINSSSLNCNSSSSSSSGYGSSHSAASTPIGSQYETTAHTPVSASTTEHVPPTATVAPVMPCYSETALSQQQRQQYYQTYAYPSAAAQYPIYDAYTGNSYHNLTTPSVERSLGIGSGHHSNSSGNSSQQQRLEKSSRSASNASSGTQLYTSAAAVSLTTTTSSTTKPQATATPFFAQPSANMSASSVPYYDGYGKYKMPGSTKLPSHAASDYASHFQQAVASLSYQHQQQHYYAAAKSQLQDANYSAAVKPHRQHSVNNATAYYGNSGAYYDKYEKYMYPPTAGTAAYAAAAAVAAPTHATHPYSPHEPTTADPYRKVAAAAAANAWHWNMEYAANNCRSLPPTAAGGGGSSYLTAGATTGSTRDVAFHAASNDKYSKYDKYSAYYANAHHQQYMTPQVAPTAASSSRNSLWPNATHHTPHLVSVQHGLNERLTHTLPPSAAQHQYPHTHPQAAHPHFTSASAASSAQRQSCYAQPFQQQSCYYPRPSQQHAHATAANPYAPPQQQSHYGAGGTNSTSNSHKYSAYSSSFKPNSSNDLYVTSPFDTTPPPSYNYGQTTSAARYGTSNAAFYNDLNMQTAFDGYATTAMAQPPPMLQQHNVSAHLGYQSHGFSQNPTTSSLLDYRKPPTAVTNEYCLNKSRGPQLTAMEQHLGPAGYLTFDLNGNPIAQAHSVITSPTIYSDGGSSSDKSTPTTKNIRDFLATWSEGEEEETAAAAASAVEHLSFVEGAPVQSRAYGLPANASLHNAVATRPKIHLGITVDGSLDVDASQFINLPDIVIDIEKPNTTAAESNETAVIVAPTPIEPSARVSTPHTEHHHSPCGHNHGHEMFESFDAEKELDELEIKRAKLCLEKQLNNEIRILTPEPSESHDYDAAPIKHNEQAPALQYSTLNAVHHTDCEKSYERPHTFLKEMELNDSTSHSSNGSTFEKEYETFINRIENDKNDVERHHRVGNSNEPNVVETQLPMINEDSGSASHQSSGIKTPPDPSDIDDLAQKVCRVVKPLNFAGNSDVETRADCEDFSDCVHDLTTTHATVASQKSMDESMVMQNFECPTQEMLVGASGNATPEKIGNLTKAFNDSQSYLIQPEDLSVSRDGLAVGKSLSSNDANLISPQNTQNPEDFSSFYKTKRKFVPEFQANEAPAKQIKSQEETSSTVKPEEQRKSLAMKLRRKYHRIAVNLKLKHKGKLHKRRPVSFFYKNLRHLTTVRKVNTTALVQQHLALLKERHLPLIKRQSIKNFSACDKLFHNPRSLTSLTVSMVNTNEFHHHILDEMKNENCSKVVRQTLETEADLEKVETLKSGEAKENFTENINESQSSCYDENVDTIEAKMKLEVNKVAEDTDDRTPIMSNETLDDQVEVDKKIQQAIELKPLEQEDANSSNETTEAAPLNSPTTVETSLENLEIDQAEVLTSPINDLNENTENSPVKLFETIETDNNAEILNEAFEEQSSATVSDNWSASVKLQTEFNGFEEESNSKQNFISTSNSPTATLEGNESNRTNLKDELEATNNAKDDEADPSKTELSAKLEKITFARMKSSDAEPAAHATVIKSTPISQVNVSTSEINELSNKFPPMRTKASVKMCDFSETHFNRVPYRKNRSKSKSLNSLKPIKSSKKRSQRSLDAQQSNLSWSIKQKPTFEGIGKIDKSKFVANWAASINSPTKIDSPMSIEVSQDSLPKLPAAMPLDEESCASSSSSSSSNSGGDNKSATSSTSNEKTRKKSTTSTTATSSTSTTSQSSSSSDSSSEDSDSDFNEMRALERELSQHKAHDDWANSVAKICQAETVVATKTDSIKLEIHDTEVTNQDIADLKRILESETDDAETIPTAALSVDECAEGQIASLKTIAEEFITKTKSEESSDKEKNEINEPADELKPQQPQIVIPKLSDLCKIALNSSFVINERNVKLNENEKEVEENHVKFITATPKSPKSPKPMKMAVEAEIPTAIAQHQTPAPSPPAMTVEEELAEMYRQAGVVSDPEDNADDCGNLAGENYTENHAQDYLLINLAEILANSDNESNVFVLQCDMNENVLRVMTTSPSGDNSNELLIGEVSNVDVENSSAVQIVQLVETALPTSMSSQPSPSPLPPQPPPPSHPPPSPPPLPPSPAPISSPQDNITTPAATMAACPLAQYIDSNDCNHDLPIIHHEEIVPDNYKKYQNEQFFKYLQAKYAQKHVKRFHHAHRISKKYRRRYLTKMISNSLALLTVAAQRSQT